MSTLPDNFWKLLWFLPCCTFGWSLLAWNWKQAELAGFPHHLLNTKKQTKKNQRHENIGPFLLCCLDQRSLTSDAALRYGVLNWHGISLSWMPGRVNRAQMPYVTPKEASMIQTARRYTEVKPCINSSYKKPWNNLNLLSLTQLIPSQC